MGSEMCIRDSVGMITLAGALYLNELAGKRIDAHLRELRELLT